ncbi:MAG: hypothetical protein KatS3mg131_1914 [Candidatus Tectimicrobiota bacterium]|nr:MAG: hypothetical protein KatS3mg131_1914 [Candidatus Tectomicrobia bacterium]
MHSMTGYGRSEVRQGDLALLVEVRSVNHRFLDIALRCPPTYAPLEPRMRQLIATYVTRGRVEVRVVPQDSGGSGRTLALDVALARQYCQALQQLQEALQLPGTVDLALVLGLRDILRVEEATADLEALWEVLAQGLREALQALCAMRAQEGEFLRRDLQERLRTVAAHLEALRQRSAVVVAEYRQRLQQRLQELFPEVPVAAERLAQEVVLFAERADIAEELTRLASHVAACERLLAEAGPVGRKLDFLVQEMHREVNTIGAKGNDALLSQQVVDLKSELEKMREQIQNIE